MLLNFSAREVMAKLVHQYVQKHSDKAAEPLYVLVLFSVFCEEDSTTSQTRHIRDNLHYSHKTL